MVGSGELRGGLGVSEGGGWGLPGVCVPSWLLGAVVVVGLLGRTELALLGAVVVVGLLGRTELALLGAAVLRSVVGALVVEVVGVVVAALCEGLTGLTGLVAGLERCVGLAVVKGALAVPKSAGTVVVTGAAVSKEGL